MFLQAFWLAIVFRWILIDHNNMDITTTKYTKDKKLNNEKKQTN